MYSAYADYTYGDFTTFVLRDKRSVKELINIFAAYPKYSGLKPDHENVKLQVLEY